MWSANGYLDADRTGSCPEIQRFGAPNLIMRCIAFIGPGDEATTNNIALAEQLAAAAVRELNLIVITGGLGGVMAAAAKGATGAGGIAIGIIPGDVPGGASEPHSFTVATGMGEARNAIVVNSADVVLAIGKSWGTLSEVALARRARKPVLQIDGQRLDEEGVTSWETAGRNSSVVVDAVLAHLATLSRS